MPTPWSPDAYARALRFAADAHRGQTVPGTDGLPYLMHVGLVAAEVTRAVLAEPFARPDLAVQCALLHDTVEDTAVTEADVAAAFGADVAAGVAALSKDPAVPKPERMADSLRRIRLQPREVWIVKLADRIANLAEPPASWPADKRVRYRAQAVDIADALGDASGHLHARIRAKIDAYAAYIRA
jgi:(p)ppGpp synthase/HD superfamily hydrolase